MLRARGNETGGNPSSSVTEVKEKIKKTKENKEKHRKGPQVHMVVMGTEIELENVDTKEDGDAPKEIDATIETVPLEKTDNIVLRKLLRGLRYFDPPDKSWGNCYNCGKGGHTATNCTSAKRKKPCFVCGSLEHNVKQCHKGKDCFICKKGGHHAKDCPEKSNWGTQGTKFCLNCGDSGHEMFSCKSKYSSNDLKEIQCYVCKCFGHLCCVNCAGEGSREVSCYRCGQLGHSGWECEKVHAETASKWTPSSCYICGEEAHTACKCTASSKKEKQKREFMIPKKKQKKNQSWGKHLGARSVPHDLGNANIRNKTQPSSSRQGRGGWITDDPHAYNPNQNHTHAWVSHIVYMPNDRFYGHQSSNDRFQFYGSVYNGLHRNQGLFRYESVVGSNGHQARFGNSSNYGKRKYGWDY